MPPLKMLVIVTTRITAVGQTCLKQTVKSLIALECTNLMRDPFTECLLFGNTSWLFFKRSANGNGLL